MAHRIDYAEELRRTMDQTGWDRASDLVIDTTAERLANGSDDAAEHYRVQLRKVWGDRFAMSGPC